MVLLPHCCQGDQDVVAGQAYPGLSDACLWKCQYQSQMSRTLGACVRVSSRLFAQEEERGYGEGHTTEDKQESIWCHLTGPRKTSHDARAAAARRLALAIPASSALFDPGCCPGALALAAT